jgi:methyl-accepting chemotaxis protein
MELNFLKKTQNQLLILLALVTIIPVSLVGGYGIAEYSRTLSNLSLSQLENHVIESTDAIATFLDGANQDVKFLNKVPPIQGIIRARQSQEEDEQEEGEDGNSSYRVWVNRLQQIFMAMMQAKSRYMQLRYLDENGNEMVRVDSDGTTVAAIPESQLQNKGDRDYFLQTMQREPGEVYISPVNLNRERGEIERPFKPVVRYGTPVFDEAGRRRGIVIANVFARPFLEKVASSQNTDQSEVFILNEDGYYISHPNPDKEWGFELGTNERLSEDYPLEIANRILTNSSGSITDDSQYIISYDSVNLDSDGERSLTVIYQAPKREVFAPIYRFSTIAGLVIFITLAIAIGLGTVWVRHLVNLIRQLVSEISDFSLEVLATLEQQEQIASQQSSEVNRTASDLESVGNAADRTAEQAETVAANARQGLELASEGTHLIEQTLQGLSDLQNKVEIIAQQSRRLGEQTSQIGNISTLAHLVGDLANQTNMLALNAAVEAVRAGEHGRGFGVVAAEIRKLADRSRSAAEQIGAIAPELQSVIAATVQATEEGFQTLETGLSVAQDTAQTFNGVRDAANNVFANNQDISTNANQQAEAIQRIASAMSVINQGAAQTATGISQSKSRVQQLREQAANLKSLI